ncbi:MAG: hypothetical protein ACI4SY_02745, partial [Sutterella sp.]
GATMATGYAAPWAYYASYAFPLVWQYRFFRDVGVRGEETVHMMSTYGGYLLYITVLGIIITLRYWHTKQKVDRENLDHEKDLEAVGPLGAQPEGAAPAH